MKKLETGKFVVIWGFPNQLIPIIGMITTIKTVELNTKREIKTVTVYDSKQWYDVTIHPHLDCTLYNGDFVSLWSLGSFIVRFFVLFFILLYIASVII